MRGERSSEPTASNPLPRFQNNTMSTTTKKPRQMGAEKIYDTLLGAQTADKVNIHFKDGRTVHGALIFNPFKGTGRIINIDQELSVDFAVDDIRELRMV